MFELKGWIALDIDGTITLDVYSVPEEVVTFLRDLNREGWRIAIATGRPFTFGSRALSQFDFPYLFLPQNGSVGLEMPGKKILFKRYIPSELIRMVENAYMGIASDFLVYGGFETQDTCYWRPHRFSKHQLNYLSRLQNRQGGNWKEVVQFTHNKLSSFPLIKCFGLREEMEKVAARLEVHHQLEVAKIKDPFEENYEILLVTHRNVNKGSSLHEVFKLLGRGRIVIAAGDDENDISLLEAADIKIAMAHAPETVKHGADFIAPPTSEYGIIKALELALRNV